MILIQSNTEILNKKFPTLLYNCGTALVNGTVKSPMKDLDRFEIEAGETSSVKKH